MPDTTTTAPDSNSGGGTLAERLTALFDAEAVKRGHKVSHAEVAEWMTKNGHAVARAYISALANGTKTSPSPRILRGLAKFFNVSVATLIDESDPDAIVTDAALQRAMADAGVREFALRAEGLDQENLQAITRILDSMRAAQQLPPIDGPNPAP